MRADEIENILTGQLDKIPSFPPTSVKLFVCANEKEFDLERKYLWHEILPDLQQHCLQYGIDIQLVDWLLVNQIESTSCAKELDERLLDIEDCHKNSIGPFFLAFIGDEHGRVLLPKSFKQEDFNNLKRVLAKQSLQLQQLTSLYELDENAVPPQYVIKRVGNNWKSLADNFLVVLQSILVQDKYINGFDGIFLSGFETEVKTALSLDPCKCVFVIRHHMEHVNGPTVHDHHNYQLTSNDMHNGTSPIGRLKEYIISKGDASKILTIDAFHDMHNNSSETIKLNGEYVTKYVNRLTDILCKSIDDSIATRPPLVTCRHLLDPVELLFHLNQCRDTLNGALNISFESYISIIQAHLIVGSKTDHQLCIIKGPEGCGKSTILARACHRARELFGADAIMIYIVVGLTRNSCHAEDIFRAICLNINTLFKQDINIDSYTLKKLLSYFHGLMNRVSKNSKHCVVFLDGIERMQMCQTSPIDFESIDWLTAKLPPKFHILVTCSSTEISAIVQRIESKLFQEDTVVYVNNLHEEDCELLLNETLQRSKRTLTPSQKIAILEELSKDRNLFVVSQIARIVTEWPSFYSIEGDTNKQIFISIEDLISGILDKLEAAVGKLCAQTICNYLTLARHGLSEIELCDTLTSNDDILLDAYNNVKPPILRFPCQIWSRAKRILEPVLCNSYIGGRMLLTWRYAKCAFVVRQRYLKMHEHAYTVHRDLADIFLENWKRKSPFDNSKECALYPLETDRLLSPQPLVYNDFMYNYRKLQELWFHLLKSGDIRRLKENTLCNFEYLLAMADADSIQRLLYNMGLIRSLLVDEDINLLYLTLNSAGLSLNSEPLQLVNELIGRLRQLKEYLPDFIEPLMLQCMEWCDNYSLPFLVPLTSWLDNVHETHVTSMTFEHAITSSTLIPNGQHLIAASDNVIMMYHIATKRIIKTYVGHKAQVTCLYLDPLCRVIISGGNDKTICVWNIDSVDQCVQTFRDFKSNVTCLTCVSKTLVVCGTDDGDIVLRRLSDGEVTRTLELHRKRVMAVRLCKDDSILVSSSLDATVILWYTEDWTVMNIITDDTLSPVLCVDISADSAFLIVGCDNGNLHVIAMATGTIAQTIHSHTGIIQSVSICGDCHHCVAASSSGEVYLYNFRASEVIDVFKGHRSPVENVMTTDNHQLAVSVSKDEMFVWSLIKRFTKETIQYSHSGPITCMLITQDRRKLVSGSVDGLLKIWNLDISDFSDNLIGHTSIVTYLDVANDNTIVVSGSTDMTCKVWSLSMGHDQAVTGLHVLTESRLVVSLDATQKLHMWRTEDGQTMRLFAGPTTLHALAPNNQHFVSGAGDNRLQIWELSNGSVIKDVNHTDKITCLLCSKNSQLLVTGSLDCSLKVWELTTGKIVQIIVDHSSAIRCLTMTSANDVIMSSGDDGVIHVCNVHLGSVERKLTGHYDQVTSLALTADDSILVSGSIDCTVRVWNFRRGTQTTLLDAHFPVLGIALTDIADRIALRLANSNHMPILCLHNTPAKAQKLTPRRSRDKVLTSVSSDRNERRNTSTSFGISLFELSSESGGDEERMLPIKPKHGQRPRSFILASERRRVTSPSIIPLIIKHSPIKAQIQATVKAQEKHRLKFRLQRGTNKPKKSDTPRKNDSSHICAIL